MFLLPGEKLFRCHARVAFEEAVEMALVGEAGFEGDFGERFFLSEQFCRFLDAELVLKFVRRQTNLRGKCAVQVKRTQASYFG